MGAVTLVEKRRLLKMHSKNHFLGRDAFCMLLRSRRRLERANDQVANVRGLYDRETGVRYFIEEERLVQEF